MLAAGAGGAARRRPLDREGLEERGLSGVRVTRLPMRYGSPLGPAGQRGYAPLRAERDRPAKTASRGLVALGARGVGSLFALHEARVSRGRAAARKTQRGDLCGPHRSDTMCHRATVLVVDDDPDTVETMREILEEEGHTVLSARNGREALELALRNVPDLVLLDLDMPVMDGHAFLDAVKQSPSLANVTVVVLSGMGDAEVEQVPCESVKKPLRLDTLIGLIDRVAGAAPA
jgi:CheY-like chemotaxis protein